MALPDGTPLLRAIRDVLDRRSITKMARRLGVVRRERKVDVFALVATLVFAFQVGASRSLDGLRESYVCAARQTVARSTSYARLSAPLAKSLRELVRETLG